MRFRGATTPLVPVIRTVEAEIDERGRVRLLAAVTLPRSRRALVTVLDDEPAVGGTFAPRTCEDALAVDWNRTEEDAAWAHLQHLG